VGIDPVAGFVIDSTVPVTFYGTSHRRIDR